MFLGKCKMAILLLSCAAFLGAGLGRTSLRHVGAEPPKGPPSPVEKTRTRASATPEDGIRVRGRVLGPDGKPLAGARLYLSASSPKARTNPVRATSGDDGRFQFTLSRSELAKTSSGAPPPQVMAVAKGHGCDWAVLAADGKTAELTLRLVKDVPIRGRVLDPDGKPVARARIVVRGVSAPKGDDLGGFFKAVKGLVDQAIEARGFLEVVRMTAPYTLAKEWPGPLPGQLAVLTTGADGRFRLAGAGRERIVRLHVEGPAIATADLVVMTRASAKVGHVHGASFDFVAVASRPIRGVVRDKDTRKPLAGVAVGITNWLRESYGAGPRWMTVTDKDGRYELLGLAKAASYELVVRPPEGQLYFHREAQIRDTRGLTPLTADIDMVRGLTVRGKVTDKEGKPIARVRLEYLPVYPNLHVNTKVSGRWRPRSEATTGADGSYVLTVLPGPGAIAVTGPNLGAYMPAFVTPAEMKDKGFLRGLGRAIGDNTAEGGIRLSAHNAVVLLNPGAKDTALVKDVALERPQERKGRVVGPDGKPLTGVTVDGPGCVVKGADFIVRGLNPRGGRALIFYHKGKNLGFFLKEVAAEKDDPFTVKLQPCGSVSGRLVDPDGEPVAGARSLGGLRNRTSLGLKYTTDKQGRFRVEGLVPGLTYWILGPNGSARILKQVVVEPGKHKDVGDLKVPAKE